MKVSEEFERMIAEANRRNRSILKTAFSKIEKDPEFKAAYTAFKKLMDPETSKMPEKKEPLSIVLHRHPHGADKAVSGGLEILTKVLTVLDYGGRWGASFIKQNGKKNDALFQFARRQDNHSVLVRTKPGEPVTGWDVILTPPKRHRLDDVIIGLQKIHQRDLTVKAADPVVVQKVEQYQELVKEVKEPKLLKTIPIPAPKPQEIPLHTPLAVIRKELDEVDREVAARQIAECNMRSSNLRILKGELKETQQKPDEEAKLDAEIAEIQADIGDQALAMPITVCAAADTYYFPLDPNASCPLSNNLQALDLALIALGSELGLHSRYVSQKRAMEILEDRMKLDDFILNQGHYKLISRVQGSLLRGLCDVNYLHRYYGGDGNHSKGFEILQHGMARLQKIYKAKGYKELAWVENPEMAKEVPLVPLTVGPVVEPAPLVKIQKNMDSLKPLAAELDKCQESIKSYEELAVHVASDLQVKQTTIKGLKLGIEHLESQLKTTKLGLAKEEAEALSLENDYTEMQSAQQAEMQHLEEIKIKIKAILEA